MPAPDSTAELDAGVPLIDLTPWFSGDDAARAQLVADVDRVLQRVGFIVVVGHGVDRGLIDRVRSTGREFF